ncbi:GCN5-related N-acetyltransferase 3, chloroplastic-like isoform X2 [Coffea arabica]|uniref:GCN5-related N-acetyltransferase 3, chloroplastic-like isoform X2 n=2 Tax=Coffea arabica TaxID=13443 RepID=A0A6P6VXR4_COFAR|nr:acetyltransferase NSI-like isoform X2 [Coffea arabica]
MAAVATSAYGSCIPANFLHSPPKITNQISSPPPLYISTNPSHVNPSHLQHLYALCNHSCHRFPNLDSYGLVELIDVGKLRTALSNSSVVVSVFTKPELANDLSSTAEVGTRSMGIGGNWIQRVMPVTPDNGKLVGFGRAVSDLGLTASIYDVMVIPSLQGRGIGRRMVQRIIRMLTGKGVYDISALCSDKEGLFFKACGFGEDILGSTTMMYTGTSSCPDAHQIAIYAGRKLILSPPSRQ